MQIFASSDRQPLPPLPFALFGLIGEPLPICEAPELAGILFLLPSSAPAAGAATSCENVQLLPLRHLLIKKNAHGVRREHAC